MENGVIDGMIGNATSQIGQGLAYVLPETRSDKFYLQQALSERDSANQQMILMERQRQAQRELIDKTLREKYASPESWTPYNKEISDSWGKWNAKALALKAEGGDPTSDPKLLKEYDDIKRKANYSKDLKEQYIKIQGATLANPGKYKPRDLQRLQQEFEDVNANPNSWYEKGLGFSGLGAKAATWEDFGKDMKGTAKLNDDGRWRKEEADSEKNREQVIGKLFGNREEYAEAAKDNYGVNLFSNPYAIGKNIPTDDATVKAITESIMNSENRDALLEEANILPTDEFAGEKLFDHIQATNTGWDKMINDQTQILDSQVGDSKIRVFGKERIDIAREGLNISKQRLLVSQQALAARLKGGKSSEDKEADTRLQYIKDIINGDKKSFDRLKVTMENMRLGRIRGRVRYQGDVLVLDVPYEVESGIGTSKEIRYKRTWIQKGLVNDASIEALNEVLNNSATMGSAKSLKLNPHTKGTTEFDPLYEDEAWEEIDF